MPLPTSSPNLVSMARRPLVAGMAAGLLTALVTLFIPNEYRSEARILPADNRSSGGSLGQLAAAAAAVGVTVPGQETADAVYVDILNSRWLRESLLASSFKYKARSRFYFGGAEDREETLLQVLGAKNLDRGLKALKDHITITRDLKTKLLTIQVETTSPELSQQVVRKAVKLLEEFVVERSQSKGGSKARFAEQRLKEARESMTVAEGEFRDFLNVNRNYQQSTDPGVRLKGGRLEAELRLRQQLVATLTLSREQALMEEKNDMPILNVLDEGNLPLDKSGPSRSGAVLGFFLLGSLAEVAWVRRKTIRARLFDEVLTAPTAP
jgi:uncharacterized protein involved in exopolysaccharide biosynthesis